MRPSASGSMAEHAGLGAGKPLQSALVRGSVLDRTRACLPDGQDARQAPTVEKDVAR